MKKKLAVTATLLQENEVFIQDEPFNGVDIQSNLKLTEIIKKIKHLVKTVINSFQIFSTLADNCKVEQTNFDKVETEMKEFTIGNRIDKLELK